MACLTPRGHQHRRQLHVYYLAPDAGTYFWHCHITPPEHLQMGMVGQLYVRPRQNRVTGDLYAGLQKQQLDLRTACPSFTDTVHSDILCSNPLPVVNTGATGGGKYAYTTVMFNSLRCRVSHADPRLRPELPFCGHDVQPGRFCGHEDKYFLLNGRSYPDTVTTGPLQTQSADGVNHFSQPLPAIINIPAGKKALLRISDLDVSNIRRWLHWGFRCRSLVQRQLLRDQAGNNMYYNTNSITLGGGESLDVILDASDAGCGSTGCAAALYPAGSEECVGSAHQRAG